ncbi:MAG: glycosyltransferase family 2 protein [Chlamydiales bacterium]
MHYSIVIPVQDEEENIRDLIYEIECIMKKIGDPWELIFIDDGSKDLSLLILKDLCKTKPYLRVLAFAQNFGQSAAFLAGFKAANGDLVITLDGDGQNDPSDIPKLIAAMTDCELVVGWRVNRRDSWKKRGISYLSNWVRSRVCKDGIHDTGCSLKVYRKTALQQIKMYKGMHRFLPALFKIEGFRVKEIPVNHRPRTKGITKYHFFNRAIDPLLDMLAVRWMRHRALNYKLSEEISYKQ